MRRQVGLGREVRTSGDLYFLVDYTGKFTMIDFGEERELR
jgi:hypothetical protein